MIKRIEITEDILKLIPVFFIQKEGDDFIGVDRKWLLGGMHLLEDLSMALGIYDHAIKGTEDDPEGRAFNDEDTERMLSLHKYVVENLYYIETLIHQYAANGGLQVGTYRCKDNEMIFEKCD